jgi:5-methylcytosine-specific restriction endonuclease McrA
MNPANILNHNRHSRTQSQRKKSTCQYFYISLNQYLPVLLRFRKQKLCRKHYFYCGLCAYCGYFIVKSIKSKLVPFLFW